MIYTFDELSTFNSLLYDEWNRRPSKDFEIIYEEDDDYVRSIVRENMTLRNYLNMPFVRNYVDKERGQSFLDTFSVFGDEREVVYKHCMMPLDRMPLNISHASIVVAAVAQWRLKVAK